MTKISE